MKYNLPERVKVAMGHTRMATQGSQQFNYNNHPFFGRVRDTMFSLAHNGILCGEDKLRQTMNLPDTHIKTDSYVAVQILEQENAVSLESLKKVAETVRGSFVFTLLDRNNNLYIVRGDNPISLYHFASKGFYMYASTEEILQNSLVRLGIGHYYRYRVPVDTGDIVRIDSRGDIDRTAFEVTEHHQLHWYNYYTRFDFDDSWELGSDKTTRDEYLAMLKQTARLYGYNPADIDYLMSEGWTVGDIEQMIYDGEILDDDNDDIIVKRVGVAK
jgi:glutamine phosphoribosylpyrophosphate amidotransferase